MPTISSNKALVELGTSRSWLRPNVGGNLRDLLALVEDKAAEDVSGEGLADCAGRGDGDRRGRAGRAVERDGGGISGFP